MTDHHQFSEGDRVEFHPGMDIWIRGCRYGTVVRVHEQNPITISVLPDRGPKNIRVSPDRLTLIRAAEDF